LIFSAELLRHSRLRFYSRKACGIRKKRHCDSQQPLFPHDVPLRSSAAQTDAAGFLKTVSAALPLTHAIRMMQGIWPGRHLSDYPVETAVLGFTLVTACFFAARLFRWD